MKTLSAELLAHYAGSAHTLAKLWKVTRKDGAVFAFTDHNEAVTFESITYQPSSVFDASAIATRAAMNVDNLEATGLLRSDGITDADIEHGLWDGALIEIREVNYKDLTMGANILRMGDLGQVKRRQGIYIAEMRGLMQKLQNNFIKVVAPMCNADLGDARCGVNLFTYRVTGSVTAVVSNQKFKINNVLADGHFNFGKITFTSGLNTQISMEVKSYLKVGDLETFLPMPYTVVVGDTYSITPGCNKTLSKKKVTTGTPPVESLVWYGDCKNKFFNVVNYRGFPSVPGVDKMLLGGGQT